MASHVIIRLQNLPLDARSVDIRKFFENLIIPDGGVHIIGGERGDAFIAFQSDEDARLAMERDSHFLCNSRVKLQLSSKTEMQNVIAAARNQQPTLSPNGQSSASLKSNRESSSDFQSGKLNTNPNTNPQDILSSLTKLITSVGLPNKETSSSSSADLSPLLKDILLKTNLGLATGNNNETKKVEERPQKNISFNQIMGLINQTKSSNSTFDSNSNNDNNQLSEDESNSGNEYNNNRNRNSFQSKYNNNSNSNFNNNFKRKFEDNSNNGSSMAKKNFIPNNKYNSPNADFNNSNLNNNNAQKPTINKLDPIIKVRNFKNNASYKDIRTFLQGIQIEHDGIKLIMDNRGNRNGCAFVKLMTITDLKKALCRNGQFYENNIINVFQSSENEFDAGYFFDDDNKFNKTKPNFQNNNNNVSNPRFNKSDNLNFNSNQNNKPIMKNNFNNNNNNNNNNMNNVNDLNGLYLKIYGLPADFSEDELKSMFNNVNFVSIATSVPTPITSMTINADGQQEQTTVLKAKKICQVERQIDLERALTRQNERVGKSKLQIFQISKSEYDRELSATSQSKNGNSDNNYENENINNEDEEDKPNELSDDLFIYMSGVPFSAREYDVRNFFQNINVSELHPIIGEETQKPTGEWCCQFMIKADRDRALEKDDQFFRNRVIKIKTLTYAEYQQYVLAQNKLKQELMSKRKNFNTNNNNRSFNDENNGDDSNSQQDFEENNDNNNNNNNNNNNINNNNRGFNKFNKNFNNNSNTNNNGQGFQKKFNKPNFNNNNNNFNNNNNNYNKSQNLNDNSNENKRKTYENTQSSNSNNNINNNKRFKTSNDVNAPSVIDLPPLPPELQKFRNSLVLLSNVSYDASREDILEFMKTYSPLEKTLKIRYNDMGEPTGDAIIACKTSDEANKACRELNGTDFMGLKIKTALVSP